MYPCFVRREEGRGFTKDNKRVRLLGLRLVHKVGFGKKSRGPLLVCIYHEVASELPSEAFLVNFKRFTVRTG